MTPEQLKLKYPHASQWFIQANSSEGCGAGAGSKQKEPAPAKQIREVLQRSKSNGMDRVVRKKFRVTAYFRMANQRPRDGDGMFTTIMDCIIASSRRQMDNR